MPNILKINCKHATYLISKQQETKLSFFDKLKLKLHMKACGCCSLFFKQINQFTNMLKLKPPKNISLSNDKKEVMRTLLQKQMEQEK